MALHYFGAKYGNILDPERPSCPEKAMKIKIQCVCKSIIISIVSAEGMLNLQKVEHENILPGLEACK